MSVFLSAEWHRLALVTFAVPDEALTPHLPPGCEPDRWEGSAVASAVAFEFERTRVLGLPGLLWSRFPEWNLRFYVTAPGAPGGPRRRGVCFVRELVGERLTAWIARGVYNEPYVRVPYDFERHPLGDGHAMDHRVTYGGRTHRFAFVAGGTPYKPASDTLAHFLKEQEWGFGATRGGVRAAYRVEHPVWRLYPETRFDLDVDFGLLYGPRWAFLNQATPISRVVAEGSGVTVGTRILEP